MEKQVLVELVRQEPRGATALTVFTDGHARASGDVPGGEQELRLAPPTRRRIEAAVAAVPWQELPDVIGDLGSRDEVLSCAGRVVHVGYGGQPIPAGIPELMRELSWILTSTRWPALLHVTRSSQFPDDPRWMDLLIEEDGAATLRTTRGGGEGRLEEDELGRLTGLLDGMRFTELDIRDEGHTDFQLTHGFNLVVLEADRMDPAFVPLLQLCGEVEVRLAGA
jgi:hypothetical protein